MIEIKSLKKYPTKGKDLPEAVEWLIDFANIGSKPGKVSLMKVSKKHTLNRPPSEPGSPITILSESENNENRNLSFIDENNNLWNQESEKTSFLYSLDDEPSLEELRDLLFKTGINVGSGYSDAEVKWAQFIAICTLHSKCTSCISADYFGAMAQSFVSDYYNQEQIRLPKQRHRKHPHPVVNGIQYLQDNTDDPSCLINGIKYSHDNTLKQVICAYALDFWHNHRELHKCLRQCSCCGKFEIKRTKRKYVFCCVKCRTSFHQASRKANKDSQETSRKKLNKDVAEDARNDIIKWLCEEHKYPLGKAEAIYNKEKSRSSRNVKSLANFKRTCGHHYGLVS